MKRILPFAPSITFILVIVAIILAKCTNVAETNTAAQGSIANAAKIDRKEILDTITVQFHQQPTTTSPKVFSLNDLIGYWFGPFEKPETMEWMELEYGTVDSLGKIDHWGYHEFMNVSLDSIADSQVFGHTVREGVYRETMGNIEFMDSTYHITLEEVAMKNDTTAGLIRMHIDQGGHLMRGTWEAYERNRKMKIDLEFFAVKTFFEYRPENSLEGYQFFDSNKIKMEAEDVGNGEQIEIEKGLASTELLFAHNPSLELLSEHFLKKCTKADLYVMRNSIYARHGYAFKDEQLRYFFNEVEWYVPLHTDIRRDLTEIELQNLQSLMRYEEHAEEYYDYFGR